MQQVGSCLIIYSEVEVIYYPHQNQSGERRCQTDFRDLNSSPLHFNIKFSIIKGNLIWTWNLNGVFTFTVGTCALAEIKYLQYKRFFHSRHWFKSIWGHMYTPCKINSLFNPVFSWTTVYSTVATATYFGSFMAKQDYGNWFWKENALRVPPLKLLILTF